MPGTVVSIRGKPLSRMYLHRPILVAVAICESPDRSNRRVRAYDALSELPLNGARWSVGAVACRQTHDPCSDVGRCP